MIVVQGLPDPRCGIICPKCGCRDWRVTNTIVHNGSIIRYRVCRNCGRKVRTKERINSKAV